MVHYNELKQIKLSAFMGNIPLFKYIKFLGSKWFPLFTHSSVPKWIISGLYAFLILTEQFLVGYTWNHQH